MDYGFISNATRYALSLCKSPEELSNNPAFRCYQMARADVASIEIAPATGATRGYGLCGIVSASKGPQWTKAFAAHYWMFS